MEKGHINSIISELPNLVAKYIYLLRKWNDDQEAPDLYKTDEEAFISAAFLIVVG